MALACGFASSFAYGQGTALPTEMRSACVQTTMAEPQQQSAAGASSVNGMVVSPHGELKVLIIFAGYTEEANPNCSTYGNTAWPGNPTAVPAEVNSCFYQSNSQFSPTATDQTISNYLYQMSRTSANPFKVTFGWLPRVNVSYALHPNLFDATHVAIQQAVALAPSGFDWASYDKRTNTPYFNSDNSSSAPDGKIDYVAVIWRAFGSCGVGIAGDAGAAGSAISWYGAVTVPSTPYSLPDGQLQLWGNLKVNLFMHEFAHNLYNPPHMLAADGVTGNHFFATDGWGMMADIPTMYSVNAWERWHLGWMELLASNGRSYAVLGENGTQTIYAERVNSDVQDASSLTATNGYYTLRDFVTTGDVVRIRIPNTTPAQYIWLENRAKNGSFDRRNDLSWMGFLNPAPGLVGMVESLSDRTPIQLNNNADKINQLRTISAEGNFDYIASGSPATYNNRLYGNLLYNFLTTANATGGANQMTRIRLDKNGDNNIKYDPSGGNTGVQADNEWTWQMVQNGQVNDGTFGPNIGTRTVGFRYGLDSNPMLVPNQTVIGSGITVTGLSEIPLNGLSVEITAYNSTTGDITIRVRYDNITINKDNRWTGQLRTYPVANTTVTNGAIYVNSGRRLTLDRSGTPQRNTLSPQGDFVNDTELTVSANTKLSIASAGYLDLTGAGTTLYVEAGGYAGVGGGGKITAYTGTTISVQNRADLGGSGELKAGAKLVVRGTGVTTFGPVLW